MRLLIVESPTKAEALSGMLGAGYRVRATKGHVVDLPDGELGVDTAGTFAADWKTAKGQRTTLAALRRDARDCDRILLATDPDREGEAIAHHLADALARTAVPTGRVALSEITPEAVRAALARPRRLNADLVAAQHARRVVDRLLGFAVSPVLQRTVSSPRPLSAGRVQTAALRLVCDREQAIADFAPQERWRVEAQFQTEAGATVSARLHRAYRQPLADDTLDEGAAWHLVETLRPEPFAVRSVRTATTSLKPPPPFTTAELVRVAAERLGFEPARTMRTAQQLYEGVELDRDRRIGLLTYPRTDGVRFAPKAVAAVRDVIARDFGTAYLPPRPHRHARPGPGQPEAHEAVRPADFGRAPKAVRKYLTPDQFRLYGLVYDRAVASQMAAAEIERTTAEIADASGRFVFHAEGERVAARGFLQFEPGLAEDTPLPALQKGEAVATQRLGHVRRLTEAPERYTPAALVAALDEHGIGRPSTFTATLATLHDRGYVVDEAGRLRPSDIGQRACAFLVGRFPALFDLGFTAQLEAGLDAVAAGKLTYRAAVHQFYHGALVPALEARPAAPDGRRLGRAAALHGPPTCERCNRPMARREGPHGPFYGCSGFPDCRETRPFIDPARAQPCPRCATGWVVRRTTRDGRSFDGCSTYPACDFARWATSPALDTRS